MSSRRRIVLTLGLFAAVAAAAALGPLERVLGSMVRIVYLHGAWVWAALLSFAAAAIFAAAYVFTRRLPVVSWSIGFGRAGTLLWTTSLLLSLWAMQTSWNGLYLAEPRWRLGVQFAMAALLLQAGIILIQRPLAAGLLNIGFAVALTAALVGTEAVMHPPSPIAASGSNAIRVFFATLLGLTCLAAWQLAGLLRPPSRAP
ncbi:MAG TPA: hypothetical protein VLL77_00430 [Anaerolineales bacterium]|nr:hypothetical protein [Anaerolineales bacterium]